MTEKPHGWGNTGNARPDEARAIVRAEWVARNTGIIDRIIGGEAKIVAANARYVSPEIASKIDVARQRHGGEEEREHQS